MNWCIDGGMIFLLWELQIDSLPALIPVWQISQNFQGESVQLYNQKFFSQCGFGRSVMSLFCFCPPRVRKKPLVPRVLAVLALLRLNSRQLRKQEANPPPLKLVRE